MDEKKTIVPIMTKGNIEIKKKPFAQKVKEAFISQDFATAADNVNKTVIVPAIKRIIADAISNTINSMLFGTNYPINGGIKINPSTWSWGNITNLSPTTNFNYSGISKTPVSVQQAPASLNSFTEFIVKPNPLNNETMDDAEKKADQLLLSMQEQLDRFKYVSIADLCEFCEMPSQPTYGNWGWRNLKGFEKIFVGEGFLIKLPSPVLLK